MGEYAKCHEEARGEVLEQASSEWRQIAQPYTRPENNLSRGVSSWSLALAKRRAPSSLETGKFVPILPVDSIAEIFGIYAQSQSKCPVGARRI
jgi:hypothetical protein